ncbi:hypothetical protein ACIBEA_31215 [Streptomyces sp. NPDC051555]|uniref:hypothetical protein n=1 Tax=Streptomyces sp. NPDC051555 TaxID=3365657 RepID=UPI0037B69E1B
MTTPTPDEQRPPEQPQQDPFADPYGTQTWQSETWDTSYQPVQPPAPAPAPLEGIPGQSWGQPQQPVAPEGWFRDEAQPSYPDPAQQAYQQQPQQPQQAYQQHQQPQQPQQQRLGQHRAPDPAPVADWSHGGAQSGLQGAVPAVPWPDGSGAHAAAETAYLPPYREDQVAPAAHTAAETAYLPPYREEDHLGDHHQPPYVPAPAPTAEPMAPDAWFRDGAQSAPPSVDPGAHRSRGAHAAGVEAPAERTAYLPPYPGDAQEQPAPAHAAAAGAAAPPPPAGPAAEYSPPTLGGSTRVVDPAQARAEGRSPIIDPGPQSAVLTAALGLLLAGAAFGGSFALVAPLIALQALTAAGWFRLNGMWPARQGIALAFAGAVAADVAVLALGRPYGPGAIIGTLGAWVLLTLVLQLRSHADPDERMYGLMASVASAALAIVCAGYLAADPAAVSIGAAAVAVAVFVRALPLPTTPSVVVSLAAAAGAGIAVGGLTDVGVGGALLGLAAGVCALVGLRVAAYDYPSKFVHMTAGVALPLAAAAPAVYLIGRVVG